MSRDLTLGTWRILAENRSEKCYEKAYRGTMNPDNPGENHEIYGLKHAFTYPNGHRACSMITIDHSYISATRVCNPRVLMHCAQISRRDMTEVRTECLRTLYIFKN